MMSIALTRPRSPMLPYMPDTTYATDCPRVIKMATSLEAPSMSRRSSFTEESTSMIFDPARSWMTSPEVTMGEMPSSIVVPRFEAMMTRIQ